MTRQSELAALAATIASGLAAGGFMRGGICVVDSQDTLARASVNIASKILAAAAEKLGVK